jgi:hypothetical protein
LKLSITLPQGPCTARRAGAARHASARRKGPCWRRSRRAPAGCGPSGGWRRRGAAPGAGRRGGARRPRWGRHRGAGGRRGQQGRAGGGRRGPPPAPLAGERFGVRLHDQCGFQVLAVGLVHRRRKSQVVLTFHEYVSDSCPGISVANRFVQSGSTLQNPRRGAKALHGHLKPLVLLAIRLEKRALEIFVICCCVATVRDTYSELNADLLHVVITRMSWLP